MDSKDRTTRIELAKAQAEYGAAMRELARLQGLALKEGPTAAVRRLLAEAQDRAAKAAARIEDVRERR